MRQRAWGLLVLVPASVFAVVLLSAPFTAFHVDLYLAGTPGRFAATVVRAGRSDARAALWLDNVFVATWLLTAPRLLRAGLMRWAPERRRSFGVWRATPVLATAAGVLDLIENVLSLALVGKNRPASGILLAITTIAWTKWMLYAVAGTGLIALVIGPLLAPVVRPFMRRVFAPLDRMAGTHPPQDAALPDTDVASDGTEPSIGICVSGGGIRAASVAIGALRRLDAPRDDGPSLFQRSAWLAAVSGGSYAAGGWRITRSPTTTTPAGSAPVSGMRDGLFDADDPWSTTVRTRRRFLDNGSLSIVGGVLNVLLRTVFVLGGLLAAVHLVAAFVGRAVRSRSIHPDFPFRDLTGGVALDLRDLVPLRLVLPGAVLLIIAASLALSAYTRSSTQHRNRLMTPAIALALAGGGLFIGLVAVPVAVVYGRRGFGGIPDVGRDGGAGLLGVVSTLGLMGAIGGALFAQLKRRWLRLGGVLLAVCMVLYAGKIVDAYAYDYTSLWVSWPLPATDARLPVWVLSLAWLAALECAAAHRLTLGGVYRKRLAATFALVDGDAAPLLPMPYSAEPRWSAYDPRGPGPELIIAATAHTSTDTFCGLPAYGFTFRSQQITLHDRTDGTSASAPTASYPMGSWWDGYPRGWIVSRSMALSGAAFASAMGRQALGTTNSLLVALNLRLGAWVPNPRFVHWFADPATAPRVHLGYLVKELFGRYQPDRDPFVYVADGGHRENLGLVELLRERPDVVCSIDASGDRPGTFQTLHEAIELALIELGIDIDIDLGPLKRDTAIPLDCAAEGLIHYPASMGGGTGRLLYGRYQLSEASTPGLLQYGALDAKFPGYSTADQFLSEVEHDQLVALGHHVGDRIVGLFDGGTP
ncbi:MAG: hypothetical protein JWN99_2301 [Ilumatobacteraceae bacterium]|nr:hypothetical protein [Ilumatobacteraceae bacterium]